MNTELQDNRPWYHGVTRYQWLVLAIASAGWIFDVYEGQIFNITRGEMLKDILGEAGEKSDVKRIGEMFLAIFLIGGTVGGLLFGSLADRFGRRPIMIVTLQPALGEDDDARLVADDRALGDFQRAFEVAGDHGVLLRRIVDHLDGRLDGGNLIADGHDYTDARRAPESSASSS